MEERDLAVTLARGRIAFGVVSLLAPGVVVRAMTGGDRSEGGARLFIRMIGARDLGVGLGLQVALDRDAPTRGWLEASALIDGIDAAASLLARHHPRPGVFPGTLGLAATGCCSAPGWHGNSQGLLRLQCTSDVQSSSRGSLLRSRTSSDRGPWPSC